MFTISFRAVRKHVSATSESEYVLLQSTTMMMLTKLEQLLNMEIASTNSTDKNQLVDLQALLCATLQSVLRRLRTEDAPVVGEPIMKGLLQVGTGGIGPIKRETQLVVCVKERRKTRAASAEQWKERRAVRNFPSPSFFRLFFLPFQHEISPLI